METFYANLTLLCLSLLGIAVSIAELDLYFSLKDVSLRAKGTIDYMMRSEHPIFFDKSGNRWKKFLRIATAIAFLLSVAGAVLSFSMLALPLSPLAARYPAVRNLVPRFESHESAKMRHIASKTKDKLIDEIRSENTPLKKKMHARSAGEPYSTVIGFYVGWEPSSYESVRQHIDSLTYIMPEWLYLKGDGKSFGLRYQDGKDSNDPKVKALAEQHNVPIIPLMHNYDNGKFQWLRLRALLSDKSAQWKLARDLRDELQKNHYAGINVDFELPYGDMSEKDSADAAALVPHAMPEFIATLKSVFGPAHLLVTQDLFAYDNYNIYDKLADANDFVVVMLYDEHVKSGAPGPIASQDWIEANAEQIFSKMDSSKVVIGLGNYGYDWPCTWDSNGQLMLQKGSTGAKVMLGTTLATARDAGAQIDMDYPDLNPHYYYSDQNGQDHVVFFLDAISTYNTVTALKGYKPRGVALWHLGQEDPSLWSFFTEDKLDKPVNPRDLQRVIYGEEFSIDPQGFGEILLVTNRPTPGERKITFDEDGIISSEKYVTYPSPYIVHRYGDDGKPQMTKVVALTFDDGPDPEYTDQILKILKDNGVHATFFVTGDNAEKYHNILYRCWKEGHEIGNHTLTHCHIAEVSPMRAELEVNSTQRIIESIIGHSTKLFRPPYGEGADSNPDSAGEIELMLRMQKLGYITVGFNIDPKDYLQPDPDTIVERVHAQLKDPAIRGHIVLLHDSGGDRGQTVEALKKLIPTLKADGYKFVRVSDLWNKNGHKELFPPVSSSQEALVGFDRVAFEAGLILTWVLQFLFIVSIILALARILIIAPLAIIQTRRSRRLRKVDYTPPVTVIVPAHNESKVICRTVSSVLDSDYPELYVIVVDDGSTDDTARVVEEAFPNDPRLTVISQENAGKAVALNRAVSIAPTEIVVCVDADTIFTKDTIGNLVRPFVDSRVGAVAGNVKVGNRVNGLTVWQSLEYITSQNFDRRAYSALGSVPIIPGAIGAWRRSAIMKAGGYESNTLAEDTDLTFKIKLLGYRTCTENDALAFTEAPDTVSGLAKQRFRWAFGVFQVLWKHKDALFRRRYGVFTTLVMPAMWIFNIVMQAISPIVDVMAVVSIIRGEFLAVAVYLAILFVVDFFASIIALKLDGEDLKQLSWLFWQRFFYRQFMYYVILKSLLAALRGHVVGWGKLQRKATAMIHTSKL